MYLSLWGNYSNLWVISARPSTPQLTATVAAVHKSAWLSMALGFGGVGLLLTALADSTLIPLPGSTDVFTVWLAAGHQHPWPYFAVLATLGALIGGDLTYRLGRKGGKEALEKKFRRKRMEKVYRSFERWGFWAVMIAAVAPPPFPMSPFLLGAGALKYPQGKFLVALGLGRALRYGVIAYLGSRFGPAILAFFSQYYVAALVVLLGAAVVAGAFAVYKWRKG